MKTSSALIVLIAGGFTAFFANAAPAEEATSKEGRVLFYIDEENCKDGASSNQVYKGKVGCQDFSFAPSQNVGSVKVTGSGYKTLVLWKDAGCQHKYTHYVKSDKDNGHCFNLYDPEGTAANVGAAAWSIH